MGRDPKPSATLACLSKPVEPKESEVLKTRCLRLAEAKLSDFDKVLETAESFLAKEKFSDAIRSAEKAIAADNKLTLQATLPRQAVSLIEVAW